MRKWLFLLLLVPESAYCQSSVATAPDSIFRLIQQHSIYRKEQTGIACTSSSGSMRIDQ